MITTATLKLDNLRIRGEFVTFFKYKYWNSIRRIFLLSQLFILFLSVIQTNSTAQMTRTVNIGDTLPNFTFEKVVNYERSTAKLSDFKGKLVILDFWSQGCKACVADIPRLESIQSHFGDSIRIFLVNYYNSWESIADSTFPKTSKISLVKRTKLPFVFDSKEINKLFPHTQEPFHVWIDKDGVLKALTEAHNTNIEYIRKVLLGKPVLFNNRVTATNSVNTSMLTDRVITEKILFYSAITAFQPNHSINEAEAIVDTSNKKVTGFKLMNASILRLFSTAFGNFKRDQVQVVDENAELFFEPTEEIKVDQWRSKNLYSYEINCQSLDFEQMNKIMRNDLVQYFGFSAQIEKRFVECMTLRRITKKDYIFSENPSKESYLDEAEDSYSFFNCFFSQFIEILSSKNSKVNKSKTLPIVNETGFAGTKVITMNVKLSLNNLNSLNNELGKYGLELVKSHRTLQMLILKKIKA